MVEPAPGSAAAARARLLDTHGPCTCEPGTCVEDATDCAPCSYLDPYWECFADIEEVDRG